MVVEKFASLLKITYSMVSAMDTVYHFYDMNFRLLGEMHELIYWFSL